MKNTVFAVAIIAVWPVILIGFIVRVSMGAFIVGYALADDLAKWILREP